MEPEIIKFSIVKKDGSYYWKLENSVMLQGQFRTEEDARNNAKHVLNSFIRMINHRQP